MFLASTWRPFFLHRALRATLHSIPFPPKFSIIAEVEYRRPSGSASRKSSKLITDCNIYTQREKWDYLRLNVLQHKYYSILQQIFLNMQIPEEYKNHICILRSSYRFQFLLYYLCLTFLVILVTISNSQTQTVQSTILRAWIPYIEKSSIFIISNL